MTSQTVVDLFAEDRAHEELLVPMVLRVARAEGRPARVRARSVRGGHGRAIAEYVQYQKLLKAGLVDPSPDIIVVAIDGNSSTFTKKRQEIEKNTRAENRDRVVSACPDPHIERWFMADPDSFHAVVGYRPTVGRKKCVRDHYRHLLATAVREAGHPVTLGGLEFATPLVQAMDLYRAGKSDASLKAFLDDLGGKLRLRSQVATAGPPRRNDRA
jgi:hypothetical protein